jgi:membrane fusion protein (multidrug efflux system)
MDDLTKNAEIPPARMSAGRRPASRARWAVLVIVLLGVVIAASDWWLGRGLASTDDAFIDGRAIVVSPQVAGQVVALRVTDNQRVKAGEVLLNIDSRPFRAARDQAAGSVGTAEADLADAQARLDVTRAEAPARLEAARAQLAAARAVLVRADADWRRQQYMPKQATTQQEIDAANAAHLSAAANMRAAEAALRSADTVPAQLREAEARVHELQQKLSVARAQLAQADLNLEWTRVTAPQDGWVTKRNVEMGDYVQPGQSLLSLVTPDVWVTANFKESDLTQMRPGEAADISVDAYPDLHLKGHVDSVQLGTGGRFTAFPPENATGNFVTIVQRVPVKIAIDSGLPSDMALPLGASVVPVVHLR